jgi:hypothetical protein
VSGVGEQRQRSRHERDLDDHEPTINPSAIDK